jgi:hypothetical protein
VEEKGCFEELGVYKGMILKWLLKKKRGRV